jgi:hypothetical protein
LRGVLSHEGSLIPFDCLHVLYICKSIAHLLVEIKQEAFGCVRRSGGGAIVDQVCYTIDVFNMSCSRSASKEDKS